MAGRKLYLFKFSFLNIIVMIKLDAICKIYKASIFSNFFLNFVIIIV